MYRIDEQDGFCVFFADVLLHRYGLRKYAETRVAYYLALTNAPEFK